MTGLLKLILKIYISKKEFKINLIFKKNNQKLIYLLMIKIYEQIGCACKILAIDDAATSTSTFMYLDTKISMKINSDQENNFLKL